MAGFNGSTTTGSMGISILGGLLTGSGSGMGAGIYSTFTFVSEGANRFRLIHSDGKVKGEMWSDSCGVCEQCCGSSAVGAEVLGCKAAVVLGCKA